LADAGLTYADWLTRVPGLVTDCCKEWGLRVGEPYAQGAAGYTTRAELSDETPVVLKIIFPHHEAEHEPDALEVWDGNGAVRLLAWDEERWAMLIERCEPGTLLAHTDPESALDVLIGLLPRLWKPAGPPFRPLADEAAWWVDTLPAEWERAGRPFDGKILDEAIDLLETLSQSQGEQVLLHQDLHSDNVLAAKREPWLVIDPKPLVGEREFALAPIVRDFELGHTRRDALHRVDRITSELGLDRERALGWTVGQSVAWAFDSTYIRTHVETVHWLLGART
jgi:streptomycin 6-kinase